MHQNLQGLFKQGPLGPLQVSDSVGLGWSPGICIANEFLGDAGPGSTHEKPTLIQKGSRNGVVRTWKALVKGHILGVSAHACSVLLRGPIQKTGCPEQTVVTFDALIHH